MQFLGEPLQLPQIRRDRFGWELHPQPQATTGTTECAVCACSTVPTGLPPGRRSWQGKARREPRRLAVCKRRRPVRRYSHPDRRKRRGHRPDAAAWTRIQRRAGCRRSHLYPPRVGAHRHSRRSAERDGSAGIVQGPHEAVDRSGVAGRPGAGAAEGSKRSVCYSCIESQGDRRRNKRSHPFATKARTARLGGAARLRAAGASARFRRSLRRRRTRGKGPRKRRAGVRGGAPANKEQA